MRIHLVSAVRSPIRLVRDGQELRELHSPFEMFGSTSGSISLDEAVSATVVAPYNPPERKVMWFMVGAAAGLFTISLGIDIVYLRAAALLPLALALVLCIIPPMSSSTRVLVRLVSAGQPHMLVMAREDLSAFRSEIPSAEWKDDEEAIRVRPLNPRERLRLRLMQIGLVMAMTSLASAGMLYMQQQPDFIPEGGLSGDVLTWTLRCAEVVALVLFVACWVAMVRTGVKGNKGQE